VEYDRRISLTDGVRLSAVFDFLQHLMGLVEVALLFYPWESNVCGVETARVRSLRWTRVSCLSWLRWCGIGIWSYIGFPM